MKNLLIINIVMSCNRLCYYCPVKQWLKPLNYEYENNPPHLKKFNRITNEALLRYIDAYIKGEWVIELSGGEPALYPEITALLHELSERGFTVVLKTNGTLFLPEVKGVIRAACWHEGADFPKYYDRIIILTNINDDWRSKVQYCKENNIPYCTSIFETSPTDSRYLKYGNVEKMLHINNLGEVTPCPKEAPSTENNIFNLSKPVFKNMAECPKCKLVNDTECFYDNCAVKQ